MAEVKQAVQQALDTKVDLGQIPTEFPFSMLTYVSINGVDRTVGIKAESIEQFTDRYNKITMWLTDHGAKAKVSTKATVEEGGELSFDCVQFLMSKREDGKARLDFYKLYGSNVGDYPECSLIMEKDEMWLQYGEILGEYDLAELPKRWDCNWKVVYVLGRETGKFNKAGEPTRYRDVLRFYDVMG